MPKPSIEDFIFKKNPTGAAYKTGIEGNFDCQTCDEKVKKGSYDERTGELEFVCSKGHVSKVVIGV